jgi:phosphoglycerate dehydrogenase-like enzyme
MTTVTTTTTLATATEAPYWNREISAKQAFDRKTPVTKEANVICVGDVTDESNAGLYQLQEERQNGVKVLQIGSSVEDFDTAQLQEQGANVLFVSSTPKAKQIVTHLLETIPSIEWIHTRSAGLDFIASDPLSQWSTASKSHQTTNAKGSFSSTLAEYTLLACSYLYVRLTLVC